MALVPNISDKGITTWIWSVCAKVLHWQSQHSKAPRSDIETIIPFHIQGNWGWGGEDIWPQPQGWTLAGGNPGLCTYPQPVPSFFLSGCWLDQQHPVIVTGMAKAREGNARICSSPGFPTPPCCRLMFLLLLSFFSQGIACQTPHSWWGLKQVGVGTEAEPWGGSQAWQAHLVACFCRLCQRWHRCGVASHASSCPCTCPQSSLSRWVGACRGWSPHRRGPSRSAKES